MSSDSFEDFVGFYYCTTGRFPGEPEPDQDNDDNYDNENEEEE